MTNNIKASDIESVILSLADITSACVVTDASGEIEEIHILSNAARTPKQIVRDVESALKAKFGIELDHKKVSVAQTQDGKPHKFADARLRFSEVMISLNGSKGEATVHLARNDETFSGTAEGYCNSQNQLRLISLATLKAVESSLNSSINLLLEDLGILTLAGKKVVVVCVNVIAGRNEEFLTGSALVKQDIWQAVVNATLDSINRRISVISNM